MKVRRKTPIAYAEQFKVNPKRPPMAFKLLGTIYDVFDQKGVPYVAIEGSANTLIVNNGDWLIDEAGSLFVKTNEDFKHNFERIK